MQTSRDMRLPALARWRHIRPIIVYQAINFRDPLPRESGLRSMPDRRPGPRLTRPRAPDYVPIMRTRSDMWDSWRSDEVGARRPAGHIGMKPTVADHIAAFLVDRGVEIVFGLCGHTNISVLAALHRAGRHDS